MLPLFNEVLIVANSGRLLAQALNNLGLKAVVIDLYADLDTQAYAERVIQIPSLAKEHLMPAIAAAMNQYAVEWVIYGSGFEYYPESLYALAEHFIVLGNAPTVFEQVLNKVHFFSVLSQLEIPHPEVVFTPPDSGTAHWFIKPMRGQGGVGISRYQCDEHSDYLKGAAVYWQKYQPGNSYSVLFLAGYEEVRVVGFNTQWSIDLGENQPFMFSGISNNADVSKAQKALITGWLSRLVAAFKLKGLNSMDFILSGEQCYVLEINARPSASMQLYGVKWLLKHIQACMDEAITARLNQNSLDPAALKPFQEHENKGYQIVYAEQTIIIPEQFRWPDWCVDLPEAGAKIATTQPICSIIAHDQCAEQVNLLLQARQKVLLYKLTQGI